MNIELVRNILLCCSIINLALLLLWFVMLKMGGGLLHRLQTRAFGVSAEKIDSINYAGLLFFKCGVLLFNVVPLLALQLNA